ETAEDRGARRVARLHADLAGKGVGRLGHAATGDEARAAQVIPPAARFDRRRAYRAGVVVGARDDAVAVARGRGRRRRPARCRVQVVAGNGAIAVLIAVVRGRNAREVGDRILDLGLRDHFLTLQDAAEQEPD